MAQLIALLQANPKVGDIFGNVKLIERLAKLAAEKGAGMAITPELIISGYPPRDLLLQPDFVNQCYNAGKEINSQIPLLVGSPLPSEPRQRPGNGVIRCGNGEGGREVTRKQLLPTYDVFDELRYFSPDNRPGIVRSMSDLDFGVTICEDAWQHAGLVPSDYEVDPISQLAGWTGQGVILDATVNLSASPFHAEKGGDRVLVARCAAETLGHPFLLCNQVGGNDDLLFDGRSVVAWPDGTCVQAPAWCEGFLLVDLDEPNNCEWHCIENSDCINHGMCDLNRNDGNNEISATESSKEPLSSSDLLNAVSVGLRDYCKKTGLEHIVLGLSGGIDSAVAASVAVRALGPNRVTGLLMPSRYSSEHSVVDAKATAEALGCEWMEFPIETMHSAAETILALELENGDAVAAENIQARLRGLLVMGIANARGAMAIATGNKSELGQGFCTLYGDMAGGYAPLGDLWKTEVYAIAGAINLEYESQGRPLPINNSTLNKAPSAELAPNQRDDQTLPPYEILDEILRCYIEENLSESEIVLRGFTKEIVRSVLERLAKTEHKRWQMPPAPRVSRRAFGQGWRQPLAAKHNWRN
jgi:NAD+ synthetase